MPFRSVHFVLFNLCYSVWEFLQRRTGIFWEGIFFSLMPSTVFNLLFKNDFEFEWITIAHNPLNTNPFQTIYLTDRGKFFFMANVKYYNGKEKNTIACKKNDEWTTVDVSTPLNTPREMKRKKKLFFINCNTALCNLQRKKKKTKYIFYLFFF